MIITLVVSNGAYIADSIQDVLKLRETGLAGTYPIYNLPLLRAHLKLYGYQVVVKD
jgi:hypothetical protein